MTPTLPANYAIHRVYPAQVQIIQIVKNVQMVTSMINLINKYVLIHVKLIPI